MLMSTFTILVQAEDSSETATTSKYTYKTTNQKPTLVDYQTGEYVDPETGETIVVDTEEEKIATMDLRMEAHGYRIYIDEYSGEVAVECIATGEYMFTNPVTASATGIEESKKKEILSQILIEYVDITNNDQERSYNSYSDAVAVGTIGSSKTPLPSQLTVKPIKDGLRVDYSIGRVDSRYLVPERIAADDFEEKILNVAIAAGCSNMERENLEKNFFKKYDLNSDAAKKSEVIREDWIKKYPMIQKTPIYVFTGATKREYRYIEGLIKAYCPDYTYEDLDNGHLELEYTPMDKAEALFSVALEYKIEETYEGSGEYGLTVRLPANGLRFDESLFRLTSIQILPYMGASTNPNSGYTFFPDGTGALFDSEELAKIKADTYFYGTVYGDDYAYYNLGTGAPHNEVVRYPVYGVVENQLQEDGSIKDRGFVAIIEEGDAMTKLISYHTTNYNTVRMEVNPRPSDTYNLSDAISVSGLSTWTVVSPRKYTGDFKIRYIMLTDKDVADEANIKNSYEPTYVGMAKAYREYLVGNGILTKLTENDVKEDIPLYIETFGCTVTTKKFLSIPYDTEIPLTSFGDIQKMYEELSQEGVTNINFIMKGYTDGGLTNAKIPYHLKWDKTVEKELSFDELLEDAKENGYGVYPDFDFVFSSNNTLFDGLTLDKHAIKTIDDRYTSKREYSATRQTYVNYFELAMSPAYFSRFYTKLTDNYLKYDPMGISVSTLGSYLSSDFDEEEPYNREDSKQFTSEAFAYLDSKYNKVLTSGGNVYTWKYVDYITDAATDSSRHSRSSATVPFLGMVLHGYVEFAGSAINMEGNIDYALLRAIENGASMKFILSYRNTEKLKQNYDTSVYYSVRYDIWQSDLVERYHELNEVLKGVQDSVIVEHKFIDGFAARIPDDNEIADDAMAELLAMSAEQKATAEANRESVRSTIQTVRKNLLALAQTLPAALDETVEGSVANLYKLATDTAVELDNALNAFNDAKAALDALKPDEGESANDTTTDSTENQPTEEETKALEAAQKAYDEALANVKKLYDQYSEESVKATEAAQEMSEMYAFATENIGMVNTNEAFTADIRKELNDLNADLADDCAVLNSYIANEIEALNADVADFAEENADIFETDEEETEDTEDGADENQNVSFNKYAVAVNSVVYEEYENGTAFVLNFNNYAIKVEVNGVYYTVDAYGYIVIA